MSKKNSSLKFVFIIFLIGLCLRFVVFTGQHREGDEVIYMTLVEQLNQGRGYTLQGTHILEQGWIDRKQYGKELFFHPPGGTGLFWFFYCLLGKWSYPFVQIFCYALFFWSMMLLANLMGLYSSKIGLTILAVLSATSPIMAHVTTKFWLDGPLLGFTTLAAAVFILAAIRNKYLLACIAGLILGYASLIKMTAFLILPGILVLAWFFIKPQKLNTFLRFGACLVSERKPLKTITLRLSVGRHVYLNIRKQ